MSYLKGKDLRHKGDGHTLECWYNSIPKTIIYKTDKPEIIKIDNKYFRTPLSNCIRDEGVLRTWDSKKYHKPNDFERIELAEGFEGW